MFEYGIIQHSQDLSVEESTAAFGLPDSVSIRNCIRGETVFPERKQLPLCLNNVKYMFQCTLYTFLVALIAFVLEEIAKLFNCGVQKVKKRRRKKRDGKRRRRNR